MVLTLTRPMDRDDRAVIFKLLYILWMPHVLSDGIMVEVSNLVHGQ